jgi:hypothetical protein
MEDKMKIKIDRIVWTAVVAALGAVGSVVSAIIGATDYVLAFGALAVTFGLLAMREK